MKRKIIIAATLTVLIFSGVLGYYLWRFSDFTYNQKSIQIDKLSTMVESTRSLEKKSLADTEFTSGQVIIRDINSGGLIYFNLRDKELQPTSASQDLWAIEKSEIVNDSNIFDFSQDQTSYYACSKSLISEEYECRLYTDKPNTTYDYGEYLNSDKYDYEYRGNLFNLPFSSVKVVFESKSKLSQLALDRISNLISAAQ